ncbi:hypothetical protein CDEF62S_00544 [Castellaniella defragrans]
MTEFSSKPDPIARYRAVLETLDPRLRLAAKLRALFPLIEPQIAAGVPHAAVMEDLAQAGLPVHHSTYTTTLRRWRKAQRLQAAQTFPEAEPAAPSSPTLLPTSPEKPAAPPMDAIQGRPHRIETPADLRKIRDMRIDLEALRQEGLAQRRKASETNPQDKE